MMNGCSAVDLITAVTALVTATGVAYRQFQHEQKVTGQMNGNGNGTPPAGPGTPPAP